MIDKWTGEGNNKAFQLPASKLAIINSRLAFLKFPAKMLRILPKDIDKKLKAFDLENILYYGVVAFQGILPDAQFSNLKVSSQIMLLSIAKICTSTMCTC